MKPAGAQGSANCATLFGPSGDTRLNTRPAAAFAALALSVLPAQAQSPGDFYAGKIVKVLVGHPPGGSYDFYARLAADALKLHLPGVKAVIVENKPGGGGLLATSWFYAQAPRDGTVFGLLPETMGHTQVMEPEVGKWKVGEMRWLGSFSPANSVFMRRRGAAAATADDMRRVETIVGCTGANAQSYQYPAMLKSLAGFKFKMICGYPGAAEYTFALERGEIDLVSSAWNSWRVTHAQAIARGDLAPVIQAGLKRERELPDVPLMQELAQDPRAKKVIEFASAGAAIGRALLAPPGVPPERIAYVRDIFDKMTADPAIREMAAQRGLTLEPTAGAAVQILSDAVTAAPADIIAEAAQAFK